MVTLLICSHNIITSRMRLSPILLITVYHQNEAFRRKNVFDGICRMGSGLFWSWIDINRSTFEEDMRQK